MNRLAMVLKLNGSQWSAPEVGCFVECRSEKSFAVTLDSGARHRLGQPSRGNRAGLPGAEIAFGLHSTKQLTERSVLGGVMPAPDSWMHHRLSIYRDLNPFRWGR